jgi:UPF0755 protein
LSIGDGESILNRQSEFAAYRPGAGDIRPVLAGDRMNLRTPADELEPVAAPPPPRRSRQARNRLVVFLNSIISLMVFVAVTACVVVFFGKKSFEEPGPLDSARTVIVREGSSLARIAEQLQAAGIIDSDLIFNAGVRFGYRSAGSLKPGEYAFEPRVSMYEVMDTLRSGRGVVHKVSLPEGLTSKQIFDKLAADEVLVGPLPEEMPVEGSLMPDTYPFQRGTTREEIVKQMMRAQQRVIGEVWSRRDRDLPIKDQYEFVTLASIVEKETGKADERPRVAAVFMNRLKKGMRLQSDPTILYGLFGGEGRPPDRAIEKADIDKPTPYNTYLIDGLPPGPIANPGRAALEAVANPARTNDLYFVADGTGGHAFAETLEDHQENVKRWRIVEKRLRDEAAKKAGEAAPGADDSVVDTNGGANLSIGQDGGTSISQ